MKEIWKDIKGYEGVYRISNYGNVYSITTNKLLKVYECNNRYGIPFRLKVTLYTNNKWSVKMVHRLVYEHFSSEINNNLDFKDGNFRNCHIDNIQEIQYTYNQKIKKNKRIIDTKKMKLYSSRKDLAKELNLTESAISSGMKRKLKRYSHYKLL